MTPIASPAMPPADSPDESLSGRGDADDEAVAAAEVMGSVADPRVLVPIATGHEAGGATGETMQSLLGPSETSYTPAVPPCP
jgi:hypothetical protein